MNTNEHNTNVDPLDAEQRTRVVAAYEAARTILDDDPLVDDVIVLAHWITTGQQPRLVHAEDRQVQQAADRIIGRADMAS